jgi:hypothetical protein
MFIGLLQSDHVLKCSRIFLWMKSCRTRLVIYKDHFIRKFGNFKAIPNIKTILMSISSKLVLKRIQEISMDMFS